MAEPLIPNTSLHDTASFDISIEGKPLNTSYQLLSLSIIKEINRIPVAKLVFRDGEAAEKSFELSNDDAFVPGKKISVQIGRDGSNTRLFTGIIITHAVKVRASGNSELYIECRDNAVSMTIGRHSKYYQQLKDSDLFHQLVIKYGLTDDIESTILVHKEIVQHHISDWDFLLLRAEANGMLVTVSDGSIKIAAPKTSVAPVLTITFGSSILEFEAEMDARTQWQSVKAVSWDYTNQQLFMAESSSTSLSEPGNVPGNQIASATKTDYEMHHSGHLLQQELQSWVDGAFMRSRLAKVRGTAKVEGFAGIHPGDMVKIDGIGDRFNGNAYVTAVRQDVGQGLWETQIQFGFHPEYHVQLHKDIPDVPNAGLVGSINGLQIGKVVKLESDPDGENRIMVRIPVIDKNAQGIWTRVATLDAGQNRGSFFLPEIDDEVIVGFINNDPRHAVTLGMLNSSKNPAPITAQDANDKKGFTTRSKMHLSFDDNTKTITIDTPAGNSITIDEAGMQIEIKDQNSNKVTMNTSGITLNSPKNVEIKAGVNLTMSAAASLSISAASLSVKADADVSVQGAIAKLSSQGITEITGSIVKIN
ncbi:type VI secretion system tip protein VgrG [Hanamia caeni]|uniref:Type VI secretion system tip protein VgrG n=1 Tax=Hanamia caeni TaxID=2294116 RepID=A0A3M9N973_9BACT|nr:type VI secretion system tip protein VgrG [Hanamia caeni]RNI33877.1 type VI secretion system tip protein VgrG [Hanamia caeni]